MKKISEALVTLHPDARLRLAEIIGLRGRPPLISLGKTKFYDLIKQGKLPRPQKIGHISVWRVSDLLAAIEKITTDSVGG